MVVQITNVTDGPGRNPTQVDVYNKTLDPGASLRLPADLIDKRVRKLEEQGLIAIGALPVWYLESKAKRGRALTKEEKQERIVSPAPVPVIDIQEKKQVVGLVDEVAPVDEITLERRRKR